jgi:hypothetical protein
MTAIRMKLTPFGFVNRAEVFAKEALSLPPKGGGEWSTQRTVNFVDHTGSLQILIKSPGGNPKPSVVLNSRLTGGPRDGGIQGWAEYPAAGTREAFVLRETNADRAMEEIFDIVEAALLRVPEWDNSGSFERPKPAPRVFEPLIPEIQKPTQETAAAEAIVESAAPESPKDEAPLDMQAMVDSLLSPGNFDEPPAVSEEASEQPSVETTAETPEAQPVEPPVEDELAKTAKKPGRGRKAKG